MSNNFFSNIKQRRSRYSLSNESTLDKRRIEEIIQQSLVYAPSAFDSQSSRTTVLLADHHKSLWDITGSAIRKIVPEENLGPSLDKIESFRKGFGTVLFFEDQEIIRNLQERFILYKDNFPVWSQQSSGMLQYIVWTALAVEGMGASLQHYNELIEQEVKNKWNIPEHWKLIAQMPFGKPTSEPEEKKARQLEERVVIYS